MEQISNAADSTIKVNRNGQYRKVLAFILLVLLTIIAGWTIFKSLAPQLPRVPSLQDNWESQEAMAHKWKSDSFLIDVFIPVNKGVTTYQLSTVYYSPSDRNRLTITIEDSDEVTIMMPDDKRSPELRPFRQERPIRRESWVIDSQEALNIFSKNEIIKSCLLSARNHSEQPIDMILMMSENTNQAIWGLTMINCPESKEFSLKGYYINAQTGAPYNP